MFRQKLTNFTQLRFLKDSIAKRVKDRKEKGQRKRELRKSWEMRFFSPKTTLEELPPEWFDGDKIKHLAKAYEKDRNTNRININFDEKDLNENADFMMKYQYYAVTLKVQAVYGKHT